MNVSRNKLCSQRCISVGLTSALNDTVDRCGQLPTGLLKVKTRSDYLGVKLLLVVFYA